MERDFRRAVQSHVCDASARTDRRIADQLIVSPRPLGEGPGNLAALEDRDPAGQTKLPAVCMAREHEAEPSLRSLPVYVRRVREEDRDRAHRDVRGGTTEIFEAVEVRVVYSGEMDGITTTT